MTAKSDQPKTKSKDEERFNRFARALMAVPKKELDKELAKHDQRKPRQLPRKRTKQ
jgi:hypothetical protein